MSITGTDLARTVAAALLVATVAAGCAPPTAPTVDPVAAPATTAPPTPEPAAPPSPEPEPEPEPEQTQAPAADTGAATAEPSPATAEPSPVPTQEPASTAAEPPTHQPDDGLTELPSFDSGGMSPHGAMTFTLHADAATGCMWIEYDHGKQGHHVYATRFDQPYRGRFTTDPPELVRFHHNTGEPVVVAAAGETFTGAAQLVEGHLDECHVGPENLVALLYY